VSVLAISSALEGWNHAHSVLVLVLLQAAPLEILVLVLLQAAPLGGNAVLIGRMPQAAVMGLVQEALMVSVLAI